MEIAPQPQRNSEKALEILDQLTAALAVLPRFGGDASTASVKRKIFEEALEDYSVEQIRAAFKKWLKIGKAVPCPADIITLIEGPPPIYDRAVYAAIKKRRSQGGFVSDDEIQYCRKYEGLIVESVVEAMA